MGVGGSGKQGGHRKGRGLQGTSRALGFLLSQEPFHLRENQGGGEGRRQEKQREMERKKRGVQRGQKTEAEQQRAAEMEARVERDPGDQDDTACWPQTWGNTNRDRACRAGRGDGRVLAGP